MKRDVRGLALSTDSDEAAEALDAVVDAYLGYGTDAMRRVGRMLEADPGFALGHAVKGYLLLLLSNQAFLPAAAEALHEAQAHVAPATQREKLHVEALGCWLAGKLDGSLAAWEAILALAPT